MTVTFRFQNDTQNKIKFISISHIGLHYGSTTNSSQVLLMVCMYSYATPNITSNTSILQWLLISICY